jgi:hypothetical protein
MKMYCKLYEQDRCLGTGLLSGLLEDLKQLLMGIVGIKDYKNNI